MSDGAGPDGAGPGGSAVAGDGEEGPGRWAYDTEGGVADQEGKDGGVKGSGSVEDIAGEAKGEEEGVGAEGMEEEEKVIDVTVGDTPKVLRKKAGKGCGQEELSVEGELEKERQLPKEVLEELQQQRREMAAVVGSTRVRNGFLLGPNKSWE